MSKPVPPPQNPISLEMTPRPYILVAGTPALLPLVSGQQVFQWYQANLCGRYFTDPRGQRVSFLATDFIHLIKLVDRYGEEPRNRRMAVEQIQAGRLKLVPGRFDIRRTEELTWARSIIESPDMIVPNWQIMGRANPGDAYIKNFAALGGRPIFRVLICGHEGLRRRAVTIFPRERFAAHEIHRIFWP